MNLGSDDTQVMITCGGGMGYQEIKQAAEEWQQGKEALPGEATLSRSPGPPRASGQRCSGRKRKHKVLQVGSLGDGANW